MSKNQRAVGAKTLDNGIRVLKATAKAPNGRTLTELAETTGLHATVVSRLLQTLEAHRLVRRDAQKQYFTGAGLLPLANAVDHDLKLIATPVLQLLAEETKSASYLMVATSDEQVMAEIVVQPRNTSWYIAFSVGSTHEIDRGSGGVAILSGRPARTDDNESVVHARVEGVAVSRGAILPNIVGVAAPLALPSRFPDASVGVSMLSDENLEDAKTRVKRAAAEISENFR